MEIINFMRKESYIFILVARIQYCCSIVRERERERERVIFTMRFSYSGNQNNVNKKLIFKSFLFPQNYRRPD